MYKRQVCSQLCLVLVDGSVGLGLIVAALAEEVLHDLLGHIIGSTGAGLADDLVDHAVAVVDAVSYTHLDVYKRQHPGCPCRKG